MGVPTRPTLTGTRVDWGRLPRVPNEDSWVNVTGPESQVTPQGPGGLAPSRVVLVRRTSKESTGCTIIVPTSDRNNVRVEVEK